MTLWSEGVLISSVFLPPCGAVTLVFILQTQPTVNSSENMLNDSAETNTVPQSKKYSFTSKHVAFDILVTIKCKTISIKTYIYTK